MNSADDLHNKAMLLAQKGDRLLEAKKPGQAITLFQKAYLSEKQAAERLPRTDQNEPSRSILYCSAASLALQGALYKEAFMAASKGLAGRPSIRIKKSLLQIQSDAKSRIKDKRTSRNRMLLKNKERQMLLRSAALRKKKKLLAKDTLKHAG